MMITAEVKIDLLLSEQKKLCLTIGARGKLQKSIIAQNCLIKLLTSRINAL